MQPILIDLDGTCDFLYVVRIRGVLCESINPLRADMSIFDERVKRADYPDDDALRHAVGDLAQRLVRKMFAGCYEFDGLIGSKEYSDEPLSRHECIVLIFQFLAVATQARGGDVTPFANAAFSLIAEDDGVLKARTRAAAHLPPGRVIGAPPSASHTEPQPEVAAAS